ncbi:MAG TPA: peptidoglycan bridge formation glycyltransferase FemA/FemB family protein [Candidatus Limnocylindrales bacterium]|nr:peptidoglycan bridge formation glycyltransferase FemA/FemB family protein [Candidatus Limnocylindrales bacterium]
MSEHAAARRTVALRTDDAAWNDFVATASAPSFLQATPWAVVKRPNGWRSARIVVDGGSGVGPVGAQVLVRHPRPLPKGFGYAARGPIAGVPVDAGVLRVFTEGARSAAKGLGIAHLRIDPEVEDPDGSIAAALRDLGWRPAPDIQPRSTRIVDLSKTEDELMAELRKKTRQSLHKAQNEDVHVVQGGADRLPEFHRTLTGTMDRVGLPSRSLGFFRDLWAAYDVAGKAMLLLAETGAGEVVSGTLLVGWGPRLVALYGGTNAAGRDLNAKYLINWAGLTHAKAAGYRLYDLWGLPNEGITYFKAGWGGRQVDYVGAWDLVVDPLGARIFETAVSARSMLNLLRRRGGSASGAASESA